MSTAAKSHSVRLKRGAKTRKLTEEMGNIQAQKNRLQRPVCLVLCQLGGIRINECGAPSRNRTGMTARSSDFKSDVSTNFTIGAL